MLERAQLKILRAILSLPTRAPTLAIHFLLGTLPFQLIVFKKRLVLLHSILSLPESAVPRQILLYTLKRSPLSGFVLETSKTLSEMSFPTIEELMLDLPSKTAWKCHIKSLLHLIWWVIRLKLQHLICPHYLMSNYYTHPWMVAP